MSAIKRREVTKIPTIDPTHQEEGQLNSSRRRKALFRRLAAFFVLAAVITYLMVSTVISQNEALADKRDQQVELEKQLSQLKKEEIILKEQVIKLNDDDYIAKLARKEYFLSESDEIIFTLPSSRDQKKEDRTN